MTDLFTVAADALQFVVLAFFFLCVYLLALATFVAIAWALGSAIAAVDRRRGHLDPMSTRPTGSEEYDRFGPPREIQPDRDGPLYSIGGGRR